MAPVPLLQIANLSRIYATGASELTVFHDLNLEVTEGELVAIMGESGAGKSTLLHLIAGLDKPTAGAVRFRGRDLSELSDSDLARFRNRDLGYVWQQHRLLPDFSCLENVMLPVLAGGSPANSATALALLEEVGLSARAQHRPGELSGGEQQRVAIARALVNNPSLLLADEPTGNLDEKTADKVFELFAELRKKRGLTTILATHNRRFADSCARVLVLEGGQLKAA